MYYQREFGGINLFLKSFGVRTRQQNNFYLLVKCAWLSKPRREVPHGIVVVYGSIKLFLMILPRRCKYQFNYKMGSLKNKQIQNKNKSCKSLARRHSNPYLFLPSKPVSKRKECSRLKVISSTAPFIFTYTVIWAGVYMPQKNHLGNAWKELGP